MKRHVDGTVASDPSLDDDEVAFRVTWCGGQYPVEIPRNSSVADLKSILFDLTEVLPKRQKVIGLPKAKNAGPVTDETVLSSLPLKVDQKLILMGTREEDISQILAHEASSALTSKNDGIVNDLDWDYSPNAEDEANIRLLESTKRKLKRRLETTEIRIINEPRPGKKLLVLDLDYTLMDTKGMQTVNMSELARPGLHRFLACCYQNYDLVVWSQTSWRWLEAKLTELTMLMNENYKLCFVLDRTSMFPITSRRGRQDRRHEVKALEIIWKKFPGRWDASNTIHIDDLARNFALNPQSGLEISAYKNSRVASQSDRELPHLMRYLSLVAREADLSTLNHKHWKQYCSVRVTEVLNDDSDAAVAELIGPMPPPGGEPPDSG